MKNKLFFGLFMFVLCFMFISNVKAENFNVQFKCDGNRSNNCSFSIVDQKFNGAGGCSIIKGSDTSLPLTISSGNVSISEYSKCYNLEYTCKNSKDFKSYSITSMSLTPTSATKPDATNGIICPSKPLIDFCADYTKENIKSKCPNNPDVDYNTFRRICDLQSPLQAMDYCEKKGEYISGDVDPTTPEDVREYARKSEKSSTEKSKFTDVYAKASCSEFLNGKVADMVKNIFFIVCVVGIVIAIFTVSGDFIKAITSGENDAISVAFKNAKTRIIAVIILLLLPVIVNFAVDILNKNSHVVQTKDKDGNVIKTEFKIGNVSECNITK